MCPAGAEPLSDESDGDEEGDASGSDVEIEPGHSIDEKRREGRDLIQPRVHAASEGKGHDPATGCPPVLFLRIDRADQVSASSRALRSGRVPIAVRKAYSKRATTASPAKIDIGANHFDVSPIATKLASKLAANVPEATASKPYRTNTKRIIPKRKAANGKSIQGLSPPAPNTGMKSTNITTAASHCRRSRPR